jgi:hypothetical protein
MEKQKGKLFYPSIFLGDYSTYRPKILSTKNCEGLKASYKPSTTSPSNCHQCSGASFPNDASHSAGMEASFFSTKDWEVVTIFCFGPRRLWSEWWTAHRKTNLLSWNGEILVVVTGIPDTFRESQIGYSWPHGLQHLHNLRQLSRPLGLQHLTHLGFKSGYTRIAGAFRVFQLWDNPNTFRFTSPPHQMFSALTGCGSCISLTNIAFFRGTQPLFDHQNF